MKVDNVIFSINWCATGGIHYNCHSGCGSSIRSSNRGGGNSSLGSNRKVVMKDVIYFIITASGCVLGSVCVCVCRQSNEEDIFAYERAPSSIHDTL